MGSKKFEVTVELIEVRDCVVYAKDFAEAIERGKELNKGDVKEGSLNDYELHVTGVNRYKESRMYK